MRAAKKISLDRKILQELVPLNALSPERFKEVSEKILVEEVKSGRYLFRKGERDNQSIYLLDGKINLVDGFRKVTSEILSGTDISRYPISNMQPRTVSARAAKKSIIARIDSSLLDAFLTWDQSNGAEVSEIGADGDNDWMTRMLQSEAFSKIPPSMIQSLLMRMEPIEVKVGDKIIRQGDDGDYFYTIREGRCAVTRHETEDGEEQLLAEFEAGDSFGEESLVNDTKRNATVSMLTDGVVMRLSKEDFVALLQEPLIRRVSYETASAMVEEGAVWVDVRSPDEYESGSFEDSVNIPLTNLRGEISELVFNAKYVMCCDTGRRSDSAAFLLSHRGFDVYVLDGGISGLDGGASDQSGLAARSEDAQDGIGPETDSQLADVIDFDKGVGDAATVPSGSEAADTASIPGVAEPDKDEGNAEVTAELEAALEALRNQNETLRTDLENYKSSEARLTDQLELLRGELGEAGEKLAGLYTQAKADTEEKQQLHEQNARLQEDYARQLKGLQSELDASQQQLAGLQAEAEAVREQRQQLLESEEAVKQASEAEVLQLQEELREARSRAQRLEDDLGAANAAGETLQAEHAAVLQEQHEQITGLREALERAEQERERLHTQLSASNDELEGTEHGLRAELQERIALSDRLGDELAAMQQQFDDATERLAAATARSGELESLNAELEASAETLQQALDDARQQLEQQQAAQDVESARHHEEAGALRESIEELHSELGTVNEQAAAEKTRLEEQLQQLHSEQGTRLEQYEVQLQELQQTHSGLADELQETQAERDDWQQKQAALVEKNNQLQQDVAKLNDQVTTLSASADEQLQALQTEHDTDQQRIAELEQAGHDKDTQLVALQDELAGRDAAISTVEQQLERMQQELSERDERIRQIEQEGQESMRKAHEDLTRKNDNEKELQAQNVRLRKKLEQATQEQQQVREAAQADIDNIREELHAERQARAEERAEMGARQRELKEQLTEVASEHETNLNNQSGAIEEARDAARAEERRRLQDLLQTQQQTEEQFQKLQHELQQAHEEIAMLHQQEKERRQVSTDLLQEQNSQTEATIEQLESRLEQLTQERDQSLEEQQTLREKLNVLRGEMEVVRDHAKADQEGQAGDSAQLRKELEKAREKADISVRLRAEAEAARDQLIQERDALRDLVEDRQDVELPLRVPSLDEGEAGAGHAGPPAGDVPGVPSDRADVTTDGSPAAVPGDNTSRKHSWLGVLVGVVMIGVSALMIWLMLGVEGPRQDPDSSQDAAMDAPETQDAESEIASVSPSPIEEIPPADAVPPAAPVSVEQAAPVAADQGVTEPVTTVARAVPDRVIQKPAAPQPAAAPVPVLTAAPVFRDKLKNGAKGPLMVELPGGSYMMGSPGNSLNFDEGPRHQVVLPGFSISKHEVSFAEYDRFARATGRRLPRDEGWGRRDRPVINVSWHDASAYAAWLSRQTGKVYRLPTESEWEYAIRAGSTGPHWWESDTDTVPANCFNCGSQWDGNRTAPVGSFSANKFGLHDMAGNVQEWMQDCYHAGYTDAPVDGSARVTPVCTQRAVRGGAYTSPQDTLRSAKRGQYEQDTRLDNLGFRVVRDN